MADTGPVDTSGAPRPPPAILVVSDRENQRVAIRAMLSPVDVVVVEADSGHAALDAVSCQTFALILMDVRMPTMDGYDTAKQIRRSGHTSRTPIIFVTAHAREDTETLAAYASGAVDFIFTPVVPAVLRAKVAVFVDLFMQAEELKRSRDSIAVLNAASRETETSTQVLLDNVADGIVTAGEGGLIESLNRSAQVLFGYGDDDVLGQPLTALIAPRVEMSFAAWRGIRRVC